MSYVKEETLLGNKKIVVGDRLHDLVLENLGRIYIRYGNSYKEFSSIIKSIDNASTGGNIIIEEDGLQDVSKYKNGSLVYDARSGTLYLVFDGEFLILAEHINTNSNKYVLKTGDTMTGPLTINTATAPLIVKSTQLVKNLNAYLLEGHRASEFAQKAADEQITGNWTFQGENVFNNVNTFNGTAVFNETNGAAIRVGAGSIITDGSMGSSQFMSGFTGYGWRLDANTNTLEIDNLIVRGILQVFELVVNKVNATNGSLWITDSFKVKKVHKILFLNCLAPIPSSIVNGDGETVATFNTDTYYIPYSLNPNSQIHNHNAVWSEILKDLEDYNYCLTKVNSNAHPFALRGEFRDDLNASVFYRYGSIFQILDVDRFNAALNGGRSISALEKYQLEHPDVELKSSRSGLLVASELEDSEGEKHTEVYFYLIPQNAGYRLEPVFEPDLNTGYISYHTAANSPYGINEQTLTSLWNSLPTARTLNQLVSIGVIDKTNIYQKNTTRADLEERILGINDKGEETETFITPIDPAFDLNLFTIAVNPSLADEKGTYFFEDSNIARVNLYYKYFGSTKSTNDNNLFILESEDGEYPVFRPGDILRCLKFDGHCVKQYHAVVCGSIGAHGVIVLLQSNNILTQKTTYNYDEQGRLISSKTEIDKSIYTRSSKLEALAEETENYEEKLALLNQAEKTKVEEATAGEPLKDDGLVRIGSIFEGTRRNSMFLTSSEDYSPYQDVLTDVNRPDYSVVYFTPKYKMFSAQINVHTEDNPVYKRHKLYLQNDEFTQIMLEGLAVLNGNGTFSSQEHERIFDLYADKVVMKDLPESVTDPTSEVSDSFTVIPVWLTNNVNNLGVYDKNDKRVMVKTKEYGTLYVSKEETTVLTGTTFEQRKSVKPTFITEFSIGLT